MSYKYFAFISYSHKDKKWGEKIHRALLCYRFPSVVRKSVIGQLPNKISPIFLDSDNLKSGHVWENIKPALDQSRKLIVICSPNSAQPNAEGKQWVNEEVSYFVSQGRAEDIIPIMVSGDLQTARCPALLEQSEILVHDIRRLGAVHTVSNIVAGLVGLDPDELWRREARRVRNRNIRNAIVSVLCLCGLASLLFAWFSSVRARERYREESIKASEEIALSIKGKINATSFEERKRALVSCMPELDKITAPEIKASTTYAFSKWLAEVVDIDNAKKLLVDARQQFSALSDIDNVAQCDDLQQGMDLITASVLDGENSAAKSQYLSLSEQNTNLCIAVAESYLCKNDYTNALKMVRLVIPIETFESNNRGDIRINIAWRIAAEAYDGLNDFSRSLSCCNNALCAVGQDDASMPLSDKAIVLSCQGRAYCRLGDVDSGLHDLASSIKIFKHDNFTFSDKYVKACLEYAEHGIGSRRNDVMTVLYELVDAKEGGAVIDDSLVAKAWTYLVKASGGSANEYKKARFYLQSSNIVDPLLLVDINLERVESLIEEKSFDSAVSILEETFMILLKACQYRSLRMAKACLLQGRLMVECDADYVKAHIYLRYADQLLKSNEFQRTDLLRRETSKELAKCYFGLGDYRQAVMFSPDVNGKESSGKKDALIEYSHKKVYESCLEVTTKIGDVDKGNVALKNEDLESLSKKCQRGISILLANSSKLISEDSDIYFTCLSSLYNSLASIEMKLNHLLFGCVSFELAYEEAARINSFDIGERKMQPELKTIYHISAINSWGNLALSCGANTDEVEKVLATLSHQKEYAKGFKGLASIDRSGTYFMLASLEEAAGKYGAAIEHYELAIAELTATLGISNDVQIAKVYMNQGRCYEALSKFEDAKICYEKAMNVFQTYIQFNEDENSVVENTAFCAIKLASISKDEAERRRYLDYASSIIKLHLDGNSLLAADYHQEMSNFMQSQKDYVGAISNQVACIKIWEANNARPQKLEEIYFSLAQIQIMVDDFQPALMTFEKCEKLCDEFPASNIHRAKICTHKAFALRFMRRFQLAIQQQKKSIDFLLPQSEETANDLAQAYTDLAGILLANNQIAECIKYEQKALALFKQSSCVNTNRLEDCLYRLGCAYFSDSRLREAINVFSEHSLLIEDGNLQDKHQKNYLSGGQFLSYSMASVGEFAKAIENHKRYIAFCKSHKLDNVVNTFEFELKYITALAEGGKSVISVDNIKEGSPASKLNIEKDDILMAIGGWKFYDAENTFVGFMRNCQAAIRKAQSSEYDMWIARWREGEWSIAKVHLPRGTNGIAWRSGHHGFALLDVLDCQKLQPMLDLEIKKYNDGNKKGND